MKLKLFQQNPTVEKYKPDSALRQIESLDIDRKEDLERFRAWMEGVSKEKSELPDQGELDELNKQATSGRGISLGLLGVMAAIPLAGLALGGGLTGLSKIANDAMSAISGGGNKPGAGGGNNNDLLGIDIENNSVGVGLAGAVGIAGGSKLIAGGSKLIGKGAKLIGKAGKTPAPSVSSGRSSRPASSTPRSNAAGNQVSPGQQSRTNSNRATKPGQTPKGVTQPRKPSPLKGFKANLETGTAFGGKGSGLQKRFHKLFSGKNPLQGFIKKIFGTKVGRKAIGKTLGGFFRKIPLVGSLIGFLIDITLGGETAKRAGFKAAGAAIGGAVFSGILGALGSILPIAGNAIGYGLGLWGGMEFGSWFGGWLHDKIFGGGAVAKVIPKATDETEEQIIFGKEELEKLKQQRQQTQQQNQTSTTRQYTIPTDEIPKEGAPKEEWDAYFARLDAMGAQPLRGSVSSGGNGPLVDVISQKAMKENNGVATGPVRTRGRGGGHGGVDIGTGSQTGYYVAYRNSGTVSLVRSLSGYGNTVIINIGNLDFLFAHLARKSDLKPGQPYNGEIIGEIGNTGRSFGGGGQHLHFEVRPAGGGGGSDIDPEPYVSALVIGRLDPNSEQSRVGGVQSGAEMPTAPGQPQPGQPQPGQPQGFNLVQQMTKMFEPLMPMIKLFEYMNDKELMDKTVIYGRDPETGLPIPNFKPVKPAPVKQDMVSMFTPAAEQAQGDFVIIQGGQTIIPSGGSEAAPSPDVIMSDGSSKTFFVGGGFTFRDTYKGLMATKLRN